MLHSSASRNLGFTLAESLIVLAIVGIAVAMAIPSSIAAINRAQLNRSTDLVVASLQEAQIESIRRNQSCTLTLDKDEGKIVGLEGCLLSGDRILPENIALDYTGDTGEIKYGIRGNTTTNKSIFLKVKDNPNNVRCLTVSAPLGIIRLGSYDRRTLTCEKLTN
jgi:prepilin-type N-terminal cleavage/methylation domain-containing protein